MSDHLVTYELYLKSNVRDQLVETEKVAVSVDNAMSNLTKTIAGVGLALGIDKAIDKGQEWMEQAASYSDSINRIRFASENLKEGAMNVAFIRQEVDKFKIPLEETTSAYGKFLAMVQGTGMRIDQVQRLHDNLLAISKIKYLDIRQLDAGVLNLGKMLESGGLDARHLRPLEQQFSGIGTFLAKEMGTDLKGLRKIIHNGGASDIDPQMLVNAIEKQRESLEKYLPESLDTLSSAINDTKNNWNQFKIDIGSSGEFRDALGNVRDLTGWILENEVAIKNWAKFIIDVGLAWGAYKIIMAGVAFTEQQIVTTRSSAMAMNAANEAFVKQSIIDKRIENQQMREQNLMIEEQIAFRKDLQFAEKMRHLEQSEFLSEEWQQWNALNLQIQEVMASMEGLDLAAVQTNVAMNGVGIGAGMGARTVGSMGAGLTSLISKGVMAVGIAWIASEVLDSVGSSFGWFGEKADGKGRGLWDWFGTSDYANTEEGRYRTRKEGGFVNSLSKTGENNDNFLSIKLQEYFKENQKHSFQLEPQFDKNHVLMSYADALAKFNENGGVASMINPLNKLSQTAADIAKKDKMDANKIPKQPKSNHIKGNSVTNIKIEISELNGMKQCTFTIKDQNGFDSVKKNMGTDVAKILGDAVNDSLVHAGKIH